MIKHVIAITGPIGSGKSAVLKVFGDLGYNCLSADQITHDLYTQESVQNGIKKFIPGLKIKNGEIDRDSLREYLLNSPNKKARLEKYVHSLVSKIIITEIKKSIVDVAMEVPLLYESHLDDFADEVIYVDAPLKERINRVSKRDLKPEEIIKINEKYNENNKKKATRIIINNDGIANLEKEIRVIYGK